MTSSSSHFLKTPGYGGVLVILLICCISFSSQNFNKERTLSISSSHVSRRNSPQVINLQKEFRDDSYQSNESHDRRKRDIIPSETTVDPKVNTFSTLLNDSHNSLVVYWAGQDVIICLAKDLNPNSSSTLYISKNYGTDFNNVTNLLVDSKTMPHGELPSIDKVLSHPRNNGKFVFTDVKNQHIFTTIDYGITFRPTKLLFVPDEIIFDPHADETIVAYEKTTADRRLWVSKDFGLSWVMIQHFVKSATWDESVNPAQLYIERQEPDKHSVVLTSESLFLDNKDTHVVLENVEEFEIKDDYKFATKKTENGTIELWISYKHGPFFLALFPTKLSTKYFHIADVADGQIFVCVTHEDSVSNLYIGNEPEHNHESPRFSLSLPRIVFFKPNVTWADSWVNDVTEDSFVDLHRIDGLRGVYIASVVKEHAPINKDRINFEEIISLVTYDNGGSWEQLKPPEFDDDGQPIYCQLTQKNCSLHISQRLSQLYPQTRAVPILSKKSAVGTVLATGTVNTTLKGHVNVYISTNGAVTWRQALKGNYLFNFGDHGGVIVAVKFYKYGDATNNLLYSTDEGETWHQHQFYKEEVRVLGLMTEPGENTTVFFIFGSISKKTSHSWILIKVDLRNVFDRVCEPKDYKLWSPWDSKPGRDCLLGKKDVYERRIASQNCYNGRNYERLVNTTKCICSRIDFECDFGYESDQLDGKKCIKDRGEFSPGVKPEWCKPGDMFYNKTKGYRKVPGDECEGGEVSAYFPDVLPCAVAEEAEFMLVAKRDSVLRIDLNDFNRIETLPILKVPAVIAIDFDMKNNCLYWADVHKDTISRLHLDGKSVPEVLVSRDIQSVEGLAFNWLSNTLYFCDGAGAKIEVIRTDVSTMGRMRKKILGKKDLEKPRGIAVHPGKSLLFWTDWSQDHPCIGRSWLDGTHVEKIVTNDKGVVNLKWPNGITIDYEFDKLYWVDANLDSMSTSDLDGKNLKVYLSDDLRIKHPFAIGIHKNLIYYDDWATHSIYFTRKNVDDPAKEINLVVANHTRLMDLKVYGPGRQDGSNRCSSGKNNSCSHLCLTRPSGDEVTCECPDGLKKDGDLNCVCPDGSAVGANGACTSPHCTNTNDTFKCGDTNFCVPMHWTCDGDDDCGNAADEDPSVCGNTLKCSPNQFQCDSDKRCIPDGWKCDIDVDCADGSDERNCSTTHECDLNQNFKCKNGRCIMKTWKCDGDDDCMDGSDERDCVPQGSCQPGEFKCAASNKCISNEWRCDGDNDCPGDDRSDETNCTTTVCPEWKFQCNNTHECIMESWKCDGDRDCSDGSDEVNCSSAVTTTPPFIIDPFVTTNCSSMKQMFQCLQSMKCIPTSWRCDGVPDCGSNDSSDELGCNDVTHTTTQRPPVTMGPNQKKCPIDHWRCQTGECIRESYVCDGYDDCPNREDEASCHDPQNGPTGCLSNQVLCGLSRFCILKSQVCDGKKDCPLNGEDESACHPVVENENATCNSGQMSCDDGVCVPLYHVCSGSAECADGKDEADCSKWKTVYQVAGISVQPEGIDSKQILIEWWIDSKLSKQANNSMEFLPQYCEVSAGVCKNETWTNITRHEFTNLKPYTRYSITVFVRVEKIIYPPAIYKIANTIEDVPTEPYELSVTQTSSDNLCVTWKKPHTPNGNILYYYLYFSPPSPPASIMEVTEKLCISNKQSEPPFKDNTTYTFWVVAENSISKSKPSEVLRYVFKEAAAKVKKVEASGVTENTAVLSWSVEGDVNNAFHYNVTCTLIDSSYGFKNTVTSERTKITLKNLAPGRKYNCDVYPINKDNICGVPCSTNFTTAGIKLPVLEGLEVFSTNEAKVNTFKVVWKPSSNKKNSKWTYALFYGKSISEIVEKNAPIKLSDTSHALSNLDACERYMVDVALVDEHGGIGPLTERPRFINTSLDITAPPKRLRVKDQTDELENVEVTLQWDSPCPQMTTSVGYNITLSDLVLKRQHGISNIPDSNSTTLEYKIKIQYGGLYQISVSTNAAGARSSSSIIVQGPEIPFPNEVQICSQCSPPTVYWNHPVLPSLVTKKGNVSYVVWLSEDKDFKNSARFPTNETNYVLTHSLDANLYYVSVSVRDAEGLESPKSTAIVLQGTAENAAVTLDERSLVGIVITVIIVVIILLSALGIFVVRHKKLQNSFLSFASSHYSTSSATATFQQTLETEDSPVIRGFSDDEPLLVA